MEARTCDRCEHICGFRFERPYAPMDWIEGDPLSPIWIIGLNPRTSNSAEFQNELRTRSLKATRANFAVHAQKASYFRIFSRVSPDLYRSLGHQVAHTDLVKCESSSWPPPNVSSDDKMKIIQNCVGYLRSQIETHKPRMLICNGADTSREVRRLLPAPQSNRLKLGVRQRPTQFV